MERAAQSLDLVPLFGDRLEQVKAGFPGLWRGSWVHEKVEVHGEADRLRAAARLSRTSIGR